MYDARTLEGGACWALEFTRAPDKIFARCKKHTQQDMERDSSILQPSREPKLAEFAAEVALVSWEFAFV